MSIYREHRERLLETLATTRTAAIVPTATPKVRNHDAEYRFRPSSDFWYLTGFAEPGSVLLLLPDGIDSDEEGDREVRSLLFLRERDAVREIWDGRRVGVERAPAQLGVDRALDIETLWQELPRLLKGYERVMYRTGEDDSCDLRLLEVLGQLRARARGGVHPPVELVDPAPLLHEQRLIKGPEELAIMRRAAEITREAHTGAMALARPGMNECEVDAFLEYTFRRRGGTGAAYNSIVAGGVNACILHYVENDQPLRDGELLLIDAGSEVDHYASDVTRTFPVNGTFSPEQRALYEVVLEAEETAIALVKPGVPHDRIHRTALEVLVRGLLRLGLLEGTEESVIADESYRRFFMHGTSHWLGLDVHDCGAYTVGKDSRRLEPGMVFTVEPGLYVAEDDETVEERWRGIGIRIEDDVLCTQDGYEVLTDGVPRSVEEVEAACRGEVLEPAGS
jgi:Xaa-Pro aminopeptidase